jgi:hypothetical protein
VILPDKIHRRVIYPNGIGGEYEVLAEMTEMWVQALDAEQSLGNTPAPEGFREKVNYLSQLAKAQGKRMAWEEAIMVYAGWNGAEFNNYVEQGAKAHG